MFLTLEIYKHAYIYDQDPKHIPNIIILKQNLLSRSINNKKKKKRQRKIKKVILNKNISQGK